MKSAQSIEGINESRMANIAYSHFSYFIEQSKQELLSKLIQLYRGENQDPYEFKCLVAGICAIEDLDGRIKKTILKGQKFESEIINGTDPANN